MLVLLYLQQLEWRHQRTPVCTLYALLLVLISPQDTSQSVYGRRWMQFALGREEQAHIRCDSVNISAIKYLLSQNQLGINYAPCFKPQREAAKKGYQQILWILGENQCVRAPRSCYAY